MSSPFSYALAELDGSLEAIHSQIECLGAGLEVSNDRLLRSLTDARQHAAKLRDMLRAERPDAHWADRRALGQLVQELEREIAAKARRNQQRRDKLLDLVDEIENGAVKHRFANRTKELEGLRRDAVKEIHAEAGRGEEVKDLPGPAASAWLAWACGLEEAKDGAVLAQLRRDFPTLERFAGEMEDSYWIPAARQQDGAAKTPQVWAGSVETQAIPRSRRSSRQLTEAFPAADGLVQSSGVEGGRNVASSLDGERAPQAKSAVTETETSGDQQAATEVDEDSALFKAIAAGPHVKCCDNCGASFPAEFQSCPFDNSSLRLIAPPAPEPPASERRKRSSDRRKDQAAANAPSSGERHFEATQPAASAPSSPAESKKTAEHLKAEASLEAAKAELERLKAIIAQQNSEQNGEFQLLDRDMPRRNLIFACIAGVLTFSFVLGVSYHSIAASARKLRATVVAAGADVAGISQKPVNDSEIEKEVEQKLTTLKGSSIHASVEGGVVTLIGSTPSKWDALHAESLALQANGAKSVKNEVQIQSEERAANTKKTPRNKEKN